MIRPLVRLVSTASALLLATTLLNSAPASPSVKTVFVIAMENTNWTQPNQTNQFSGGQQQIFQNAAAPFINGMVNGTSMLTINGIVTNIGPQTSYATHYHNVGSNALGTGLHVHPSEPNYIWSEAGSNLSVTNDNQPFGAGGTNQDNSNHLTTYLTTALKTWKSYQEDIDLVGTGNAKTNTLLDPSLWFVPLLNLSGTSNSYVNPYNGAHQYDYAVKHNPMAFFSDTNGGNDLTPTNPQTVHYAPLQQLAIDLNNNAVADYNWITPNQFNDMHTALTGGFTYNGTLYTSGAAKVAQGDNFLKQILPIIMSSQAYQNNGAIILWWDESEPDQKGNQDDFDHVIPEIVISPLAHPNVGSLPYASTIDYTHSSDLRTMQEVFGAGDSFLLDAATAPDLADLFAPGALLGPFTVTRGGFVRDRRTQHFVQQVTVQNGGPSPLSGPVYLILDDLSSNASLANLGGITNNPPFGHPYVLVPGTSGGLAAGASASVMLEFGDPTNTAISYTPRVLHGAVVP